MAGTAAQTQRPERRTMLRALRSGWWILVLILVGWLITTRFDQIRAAGANANVGLLVVVGMLVFLQPLPGVGLWRSVIARLARHEHDGGAQGSKASPSVLPSHREILRVTLRSLPARYIPGSIWYAASRATMLTRVHGVPARHVATAAALETVLSLATAVALGAGLLLLSGQSVAHAGLLAAAGVGALALASPPVVTWALRRRSAHSDRFSTGDLGAAVGWMTAHWALTVAIFLLYLQAFPALSGGSLATRAGSYLISWAVGLLAIVAPQGAGVFEITLAGLFTASDVTGASAPAVAVILGGYRGLIVIRDATLALISWMGRRGDTSPQTDGTPDEAPVSR